MEVAASTDIGAGTRLLLGLWRGIHGAGYCAQGEENWESLLAACSYHQVSPIVFHRLKNHSAHIVPSGILERLRARFYRISAYNHRLAMLLVELIEEFEREQIPCLALKGPAVALAAYGDLSLRQYEDIDILIRAEHVAKAVETLFNRGFHPALGHDERYKDVKLYHEITLMAPDESYSLDLHWQLAPPYARVFGPDPAALWGRAATLHLPAGDVPVLSREDMFLALCQHGSRHRWWQLKWLFDIAEILRSASTLDWSRVDEVMKMYPMARPPASMAALLARELLGAQVSPPVAEILAASDRTRGVARAVRSEFLTKGQTNGSAHDTLLGLEQRPLERAKYMVNEAVLYPVREVLFTVTDKDRQFVTLPENLRVLYYLIRPLRLMVQHGRGAARRIWSMAR
jgi:hypothetical protein